MKDKIRALLTAGLSPLLLGRPGIGKTATVAAVAAELGVPLTRLVVKGMRPEDLAYPGVNDAGYVILRPHAWAADLAKAAQAAPGRMPAALLFLDEITAADPDLQHGLLSLVYDRQIGGIKLPVNVGILAAGNPDDEATTRYPLDSALVNRFVILEFHVSQDWWLAGLARRWWDGGQPRPVSEELRPLADKWAQLVAGFLAVRRELIDGKPASTPWPSRRSWEAAVYAAATAEQSGIEPFDFVAGCVGEGPAVELLSWVKNQDIPAVEDVLANPEILKGCRPDVIWVACQCVLAAVSRNSDSWLPAWAVAAALQNIAADCSVYLAKSLIDWAGGVNGILQKKLPVPVHQLTGLSPLLKELGII